MKSRKAYIWVCFMCLSFIFIAIGVSGCSFMFNKETSNPTHQKQATNATIGERNALRAAMSYIRTMPFSEEGLIDQLLFEGYTLDEATYGAKNCGADWFEQAKKSAAQYLQTMAFSKQELIRQLEYEKFTHEQAVYGVEAVYR